MQKCPIMLKSTGSYQIWKRTIIENITFHNHSIFSFQVCLSGLWKTTPVTGKGITHGTGPIERVGFTDYSGTAAIVVFALFFDKMLVKPGERSSTHIKKNDLKNEL